MSEILSIIQKHDGEPSQATRDLGARGEAIAAEHLVQNAYRIVLANFKAPIGRNSRGVQVTGEIDLIALDGGNLCFIEVKTRRSDEFTPVITNVDRRKQRQIIRTARIYRRIFNIRDMPSRYDVVTVLIPKHAAITIELTKSFWTENKFRKRRWHNETWQDFA